MGVWIFNINKRIMYKLLLNYAYVDILIVLYDCSTTPYQNITRQFYHYVISTFKLKYELASSYTSLKHFKNFIIA